MIKGIVLFALGAVAAAYYLYKIFDGKFNKAVEALIQENQSLADRALVDALFQGDFKKTETLSMDMTGDELSLVAQVVLSDPNGLSICEKWQAEYSKSSKAMSMLGAALTKAAWDARGAAVARQLSDTDIDTFLDYLEQAKTVLEQAIEMDPALSMNYPNMVSVSLGLSDKEAAVKVFQKAINNKADCFDVYLAMARLYTPKWMGSQDELLGFCRKYSKEQPKRLSGLVAYAHYEIYVQECMNGNKNAISYLKSRVIGKFVTDAYVNIANEPVTDEVIKSLNQFAAVFYLVEDKLKAKQVFEKIGVKYTLFPWRYQEHNPAAAFLKARVASGLPVAVV